MSLSYVVDGETELDSELFNPIIDRVNGDAGPLANMRAGVANVLDYSGTHTEKVKSALADLSAAGGGTAVFKGELELTERIVIPANVRVANGSFWSEAILRPASGFAEDSLLQSGANAVFEDITVDLNAHATCVSGITIFGNGTLKRSAVRRCNVKNALASGIYTWTGQGVWIEDNEVENCGIGVRIDSARSDGVWVVRNRITNTEAGRMEFGVLGSGGETPTQSPLTISENYVEGADYPTPNGASACGIMLYRCPGARATGNHVTRCGNPANRLGAGIIAGGESEGSLLDANQVWDCTTTGIYVETDGAHTDIDTIPGKRGATVANNTVHGCLAGLSMSYAAGSRAIGNHIYENDMWGIVVDSDFIDVSHNHVYNNWQDPDLDPPESTNPVHRAGIRSYAGYGTFIGNHAFDNQAEPTQYTGMEINIEANVVALNQLRGTDAYFEGGAGTANTKVGNVEQDI